MQVNSYAPDTTAVDHLRLVLQGAGIVRFANNSLDAYKEKKDFVYVAIFIGRTGEVCRYFLFQTREGGSKVGTPGPCSLYLKVLR